MSGNRPNAVPRLANPALNTSQTLLCFAVSCADVNLNSAGTGRYCRRTAAPYCRPGGGMPIPHRPSALCIVLRDLAVSVSR